MSTPKLSLPYLRQAQTQKHIIVNDALERVDAAVQLSIVNEANAPDPNAVSGTCFLVGSTPIDEFTGHSGDVAMRGDGGWSFLAPKDGLDM